jgi:hypothetical protein
MRGVVYNTANPPNDPFYQLSHEDIASLMSQAVGLPIRVEHETHDVGRVVAASFNGVEAVVEWEFQESASGWAAEKLVELQQIKELSLKHIAYENGNKKPLEVSLVRKGARPATQIITETYKQDSTNLGKLSATSDAEVTVMASETAAMPAAVAAPTPAVPEVPAAAVAVSDLTAAVPAADAAPDAHADEPAAKRGKFESPLDFINSISTKISDGETMQIVADYIAQSLEANIANEQEIKSLKEAKAILEQAQQAHVGASKNVVSDITRVLSDLYSQFAKETQVSEESKNAFIDSLSTNTAAMEFVRPILVAASAIHQVTAKTVEDAKSVQLKEALARINTLQSQMNSARKLQPAPAAPAVQPGWTAMPPPAMAPMAPQPVMVAASGAGPSHGAPPAFKMPDIIGRLTSLAVLNHTHTQLR